MYRHCDYSHHKHDDERPPFPTTPSMTQLPNSLQESSCPSFCYGMGVCTMAEFTIHPVRCVKGDAGRRGETWRKVPCFPRRGKSFPQSFPHWLFLRERRRGTCEMVRDAIRVRACPRGMGCLLSVWIIVSGHLDVISQWLAGVVVHGERFFHFSGSVSKSGRSQHIQDWMC